MKLFECQRCGQLLYFENTRCERCGSPLGYLAERAMLSALAPLEGENWRPLAAPERAVRLCANAEHDACNWLVPLDSEVPFCLACRHNRTVPDLDVPGHLVLWRRLEIAKRRLIYGLLRFELPLVSKRQDGEAGLAFDFLSDDLTPDAPSRVLTGHAQGLITINIAEADDAARERARTQMGEPYRTLLGHFRHEVGHYYWERLVQDGGDLAAFRAMFGDERRDYGAALQAHYTKGAPSEWRDRFVTSYASAHPWEDFAETWAHYLHIVDTLETAAAFGLRLAPRDGLDPALATAIDFDPYRHCDFDALIRAWLPLTYAVNSLNQSMGLPDLYPFVLAPAVMGKLRFVHGLIFSDAPADDARARP